MNRVTLCFCCLSCVGLVACGDDDTSLSMDAATDTDSMVPGDGSTDGSVSITKPDEYVFESRFTPGESSVNYRGQTTRSVLIRGLVDEMKKISLDAQSGSLEPTAVDEPGEVIARLNGFFRDGAADLGARELPLLVDDPDQLCQATYEDVSAANLIGKVAGEDDATDHRDWDGDDTESASPEFEGWASTEGLASSSVQTPVELIDAFFATFEEQVRACVLNVDDCVQDIDGNDLPLYVTPTGLDLVQLVEKFLLASIHFSQGTDDYLDDDVDTPEKGLLADHTMPREDGAPDTTVEHAWDEGFGYFGAAINYGAYTDDEIRGSGDDRRDDYAGGYQDFDGDACIDVFSEYNFAASVNAAKRDAGSTTGTDFTNAAFEAFLRGRTILANATGPLSDEELDALREQRDIAVSTWEQALAATAVHYVNDVIADMADCGTDDYDFTDHAKHWSELKGFALAFQFNPRSPFNTPEHDFAGLHDLIGDAPVLCPEDGFAAYQRALITAQDAIQAAYGFAEQDVADW